MRVRPRPGDDARAEAARRRRVAEVFGDVLPETTGDERGSAGEDGADQNGAEHNGADDDRDRWYREQVPPHHG